MADLKDLVFVKKLSDRGDTNSKVDLFKETDPRVCLKIIYP